MKIEAVIEPIETGGYRMRSGTLDVTLEAETREGVIEQFENYIQARWNHGAAILEFEVPGSEHPLQRFAGIMKDDPIVDEWREAMSAYRRQVDEEAS